MLTKVLHSYVDGTENAPRLYSTFLIRVAFHVLGQVSIVLKTLITMFIPGNLGCAWGQEKTHIVPEKYKFDNPFPASCHNSYMMYEIHPQTLIITHIVVTAYLLACF